MNTPIYQPYTYLIGWTKYNKWYYGCQYGKDACPDNLWDTYFTSSKEVVKFRKMYGEPDVIEIRRTFESVKECRLWEHKVLKKLNVVKEEKWLNRTDNKSIDYEKGLEGSRKGADKIRGKPRSLEARQLTSEGLKHFYKTPEGIQLREQKRARLKQIPFSDESRKMSAEKRRGTKNLKLSARCKGLVSCYDSNGTFLKVTKEEFHSRADLVGVKKFKTQVAWNKDVKTGKRSNKQLYERK